MTVLTISGLPGTGKSTVAQILTEKTGLRYVYSGELFRRSAQEHGMTLAQFGAYCERHPKVDRELDDHQVRVLSEGDVIVEGRIAGWLAARNKIPAYKVLLTANLDTRVARVMKREQGTFEERRQEVVARERSEAARYRQYYGIDVADTSIYDLVVDTVDKTPEQVAAEILAHLPS